MLVKGALTSDNMLQACEWGFNIWQYTARLYMGEGGGALISDMVQACEGEDLTSNNMLQACDAEALTFWQHAAGL